MPIELQYAPDARLVAQVAAYGGAGPVAEQGQMQGAQLDQQLWSGLNQIQDNVRQQQALGLSAQQHASQDAQGWARLYQQGQEGEANRQARTQDAADAQSARREQYQFLAEQKANEGEANRAARMEELNTRLASQGSNLEWRLDATDEARKEELDRQEKLVRNYIGGLYPHIQDVSTHPATKAMYDQAMLGTNASRRGLQLRLLPRLNPLPQQGGQTGGPMGGGGIGGLQMPGQGGDQELAQREDGGQQQLPPGTMPGPMPGTYRAPDGTLFHYRQTAHGSELAILQQPPHGQVGGAEYLTAYNHIATQMGPEASPDAIHQRTMQAMQGAQAWQREQQSPVQLRPGYSADGRPWERRPHVDYTQQMESDYRTAYESADSPLERALLERRRLLLMHFGSPEAMPGAGGAGNGWGSLQYTLPPLPSGGGQGSARDAYNHVVAELARIDNARRALAPGLRIGTASRSPEEAGPPLAPSQQAASPYYTAPSGNRYPRRTISDNGLVPALATGLDYAVQEGIVPILGHMGSGVIAPQEAAYRFLFGGNTNNPILNSLGMR